MWEHTGWMMNGMGFGMVGAAIFWILLIVLIVVLVVALSKGLLGGGAPPQRPEKTALEILMQRYAAGEIGREEFEQKKRDLGG